MTRKRETRALGLALALVCVGLVRADPADTVSPTPASSAVDAAKEVRLYGAGGGRFEVMAEPGAEGLRLAQLAELAWGEWSEQFAMPTRLPVAITVRLVPESTWGFGAAPLHVVSEAGGIVSVWLKSGVASGVDRDRLWLTGLADGIVRRKAIFLGADPASAQTPAWIRAALAEAALIVDQPAMMDAWQARIAAERAVPSLRDILFWDGTGLGDSGEARGTAAYGLWVWLHEQGNRGGAWRRFLDAVVTGGSAGASLAREYSRLVSNVADAREWELAWQVAAARQALVRTTPAFTAVESRRRLERLMRFVVRDAQTGEERMLPEWGEWASRKAPWLAAERDARARLIASDLVRIHPFYRNAAVSLGRAWTALSEGNEKAWRKAGAEWVQDWSDGLALEEASRRLLDQMSGH